MAAGKSIDRIKLGGEKARVRDPRFKRSGLKKCIQCGRCTASCPAALVYEDFRPRDVMRRLLLGEIASAEMNELIWKCGQCYSCRARCPRNCSAGGCIVSLRADAVKKGLVPVEVQRMAGILKDDLSAKGDLFLPTLMSLEDELGAEAYGRYLEKRKRLGYREGDPRLVPIPEEALVEIREIMRLTGYTGEKNENKRSTRHSKG